MSCNSSSVMNERTIVVGSGISGLTAAAILAKKGQEVLVLEQNRRPGGSLRSFMRRGISFDTGFHYTGCLGEGQVLRALWSYLGLMNFIRVLPFPEDGCDILELEELGKRVNFYFSYDRASEELKEKFPAEQQGISRYFDTLKKVCSSIPFYNLDLALSPFLRCFFSASAIGLSDFLSQHIEDELLRQILSYHVFLYGVPAQKSSLGVHAMVAHGFLTGAYGIEGGGQAIIDGLLSILDRHGVKIQTGERVRSIETASGRVAGVVTDRDFYEAGRVIYSGHPSNLAGLVESRHFRPAYTTRLKELENSVSMFVMFGAFRQRELAKEFCYKNVYLISKRGDLLHVDQKAPDRASVLITAPGARDFCSNFKKELPGVIVMRPSIWQEVERFCGGSGERRKEGYRQWKESEAEKLVRRAETVVGKGSLEMIAAASPYTFKDELCAPEGCVYGPAYSMNQINPGARTRLPGLWLTGQGTLMTGVVGASLAALVTVGEMEGLESLWDEVRKCR